MMGFENLIAAGRGAVHIQYEWLLMHPDIRILDTRALNRPICFNVGKLLIVTAKLHVNICFFHCCKVALALLLKSLEVLL